MGTTSKNAELVMGMVINYPKIFRDLAPERLKDNERYFHTIMCWYQEIIEGLVYDRDIELVINSLKKFDLDLEKLPLDASKEMISKEGFSETEACITFASKSIIKVDSIDWKQIIEFRQDREATEKLRRFRLFAYDNYRGKSKAYVEDDLLRRLDEYETTVKQWGFETAEGALNILASSKTLAGTRVQASSFRPCLGRP
jgi:hypothetical protein